MTCGVRITSSTNSDNVSPQETTKQDAADIGADGAGLSCPGSKVVAEKGTEEQWLGEGEIWGFDVRLDHPRQSLCEWRGLVAECDAHLLVYSVSSVP